MTVLALNTQHRLALLTAAVLDTLDAEFTEAELDRDDSPPRTVLYNLASALEELTTAELETRNPPRLDDDRVYAARARAEKRVSAEANANAQSTEVLMRGIGDQTNRVEQLRDAILTQLQEA